MRYGVRAFVGKRCVKMSEALFGAWTVDQVFAHIDSFKWFSGELKHKNLIGGKDSRYMISVRGRDHRTDWMVTK